MWIFFCNIFILLTIKYDIIYYYKLISIYKLLNKI